MERNTLLAILLSFVLVFLVLTFFAPEKKETLKKEGQVTKKEVQEERIKKPVEKRKDEVQNSKDANVGKEVTLDKIGETKDRKIVPSPAFDIKKSVSVSQKIKNFDLENEVMKISFTTIDAAITSAKLKHYKDEKGKLIDAVFNKNDKSILPLSTSFVGAKELDRKTKAVYEYAIYNYMGKERKLTCTNTGTLLDRHKDYFEVVKDNITRVINTYKDYEANFQVVLFIARYSIKEAKPKEIEFVKSYVIGERNYTFNLDFRVKNLSSDAVVIESNDEGNQNASFYIHWGSSLGPFYREDKKTQYDEAIQTAYLAEGEDLSTEEYIIDSNKSGFNQFKWLSIDSRYLMLSLIPDWNKIKLADSSNVKRWNKNNYFGEVYAGPTKEVSSFIFWKSRAKIYKNKEVIGLGFHKIYLTKLNETKDFHLTVFLGPKTRSLLSEEHYDDFELIKVRDRSWMPFIKPLEWAMEWLLFASYDYIFPNFGVAIVLLTIVLKILLHPLTRKSLEATRKMSELQPKIKELEVKFKNSKEKQQKALMQLYKKEGINPLGGCVPILFQLPVFFALWNVLPYLLELKSSNFLWIKDLSSPDTVAHLPLILTNDLNILPIIMTITSVIQMKFTPQATPTMGIGGDNKAQTAKMMQYTMPVVFLLIFWSMPSGLVLYWTVQNILQISQQLYTNLRGKVKQKRTK